MFVCCQACLIRICYRGYPYSDSFDPFNTGFAVEQPDSYPIPLASPDYDTDNWMTVGLESFVEQG